MPMLRPCNYIADIILSEIIVMVVEEENSLALGNISHCLLIWQMLSLSGESSFPMTVRTELTVQYSGMRANIFQANL